MLESRATLLRADLWTKKVGFWEDRRIPHTPIYAIMKWLMADEFEVATKNIAKQILMFVAQKCRANLMPWRRAIERAGTHLPAAPELDHDHMRVMGCPAKGVRGCHGNAILPVLYLGKQVLIVITTPAASAFLRLILPV